MEVTGLKPDTVYFFYLAAGNQVGFGKSVKLRIKTSRNYPKLIGKHVVLLLICKFIRMLCTCAIVVRAVAGVELEMNLMGLASYVPVSCLAAHFGFDIHIIDGTRNPKSGSTKQTCVFHNLFFIVDVHFVIS